MKKERKPENFISKPFYEGGKEAMKKFVAENLRYPSEAIENKISGVVKIDYDIDYQGNVVKTKVIKGLGYGCDNEAQRIVRLFRFRVKRPKRGKVVFHKSINIHFNLKESPQENSIQDNPQAVKYNYISSEKEPNSNSYFYTWEITK